MKIQMVDTVSQYQKVQEEIDAAVLEVVRSGWYINGPKVASFRDNLSKFMDDAHVIPCANGTDALQIALMALGLEPGDEVITPSFTYIATVEVIGLLQLKPVFVEVDPDSFNMDPAAIEAAITDKAKVILPVHLYGQTANMAPILEIARKHGLKVVEDTAQAIGAEYTFPDGRTMKCGTIGDIGTMSFYPSKNLGAFGDGGAIFTRDEELADALWMICNHGSRKKYFHESIGVNSRLDAIQAAILDIKLKHLNSYNDARRAAADRYDALLADCDAVVLPHRVAHGKHVFHQYTLKVKAGRAVRDALQQSLKEAGIPSMIYYPLGSHIQPAYTQYGYTEGDMPLTEKLTEEVISLPMHSELTEEMQAYICQHVKKALDTPTVASI
ncbi:MAG: DegT/DnrJ/EryC1/StrS family aminotransferase [Bacteroidota bacterium]